jgi:hypothetical protein
MQQAGVWHLSDIRNAFDTTFAFYSPAIPLQPDTNYKPPLQDVDEGWILEICHILESVLIELCF